MAKWRRTAGTRSNLRRMRVIWAPISRKKAMGAELLTKNGAEGNLNSREYDR